VFLAGDDRELLLREAHPGDESGAVGAPAVRAVTVGAEAARQACLETDGAAQAGPRHDPRRLSSRLSMLGTHRDVLSAIAAAAGDRRTDPLMVGNCTPTASRIAVVISQRIL
jgi:hypothetical protein